jgi:hypothetical protein
MSLDDVNGFKNTNACINQRAAAFLLPVILSGLNPFKNEIETSFVGKGMRVGSGDIIRYISRH